MVAFNQLEWSEMGNVKTKLATALRAFYVTVFSLLSVGIMTDNLVVGALLLALTLILIPKIGEKAAVIPLVKTFSTRPAFIFAGSICLIILWAAMLPPADGPTLAEKPPSNQPQQLDVQKEESGEASVSSEPDNAYGDLSPVRVVKDKLQIAYGYENKVERVIHCAEGQALSMRIYMFDRYLNVVVPEMRGDSWDNNWGRPKNFYDAMIPYRDGKPLFNKIISAQFNKEEDYDGESTYYADRPRFMDHYDKQQVPRYALYRDGSKLIPMLMGGEKRGIQYFDPDTYVSRSDFNFYDCKEVPENSDQSHIDSFVAILQAYSDGERRVFERKEREKLEKEAKAVL